MNELTNDEREMLLKLIQLRCIIRKHIEGTPTEWVVIHDKIESDVVKEQEKKPSKKMDDLVSNGETVELEIESGTLSTDGN